MKTQWEKLKGLKLKQNNKSSKTIAAFLEDLTLLESFSKKLYKSSQSKQQRETFLNLIKSLEL